MAAQPDDAETPEIEEETVEAAEPDEEALETSEAAHEDDDDEEEVIISFDGEPEEEPSANESSVIREMRRREREKDKRIAELERAQVAPKVERRAKPTLDDHGYDEEAYDADLLAWNAEEAKAREAETKAQQEQREAEESWQQDFNAYQVRKTTIGLPDFEDAENAVRAALNTVQQGVIIRAANDPAAVIAALGKNETRLAEIAKQTDPIKLAAAIARMEGSVKITRRKRAPELDRPLKGSAQISSGTADEELEKLEKEAEKTGNRTRVIEYKRKLREREK